MDDNPVDARIARQVALIHVLMDDVLDVLRQARTDDAQLMRADLLRRRLRRELTLLASMWRERTMLASMWRERTMLRGGFR